MKTTKTELHVSDVLSPDDIIESDKRVFFVIAGVGSGKNTWADKFLDSEALGKEYSILYITSRAAIADAHSGTKTIYTQYGTPVDIDVKRTIDVKDFRPRDCFGTVDPYDFSVIMSVTNSSIERFMKEGYKEDDPDTHIWNHLDFVFFDECHAFTTDAVFSNAPFYVDRFLRLAYRENPKLKFIFMTGTSEPAEWVFETRRGKKDFVEYNLLDKCICVSPKVVKLTTQKDAQKRIILNIG